MPVLHMSIGTLRAVFGRVTVCAAWGALGDRYGVNVRELGESFTQPQDVTRVEWYCGLALINGRAAARIAGFDATA